MKPKEGDYTHVKISQIVSSCKQRLRIESSDDDIFLERYANEGSRHFDSLSTFIKRECELEIEDGKARLPNGFYQMLSLSPCEDNGDYTYVDTPFLRNHGFPVHKNFIDGSGIFQIQDGYIYFSLIENDAWNHGTNATG